MFWKGAEISANCGDHSIHKKGDNRGCTNYRGISLLSFPGNVCAKCLEKDDAKQLNQSLIISSAVFVPDAALQTKF